MVVGRCLPYGDGITYWPLTEVANELAGGDGVPGITRLLGDDPAPARSRLRSGWWPAGTTRRPRPDPQWAVRRLFEAVARRGHWL